MAWVQQSSSVCAVLATLALAACGGGSSGNVPPSATVAVSPKLAAVVATTQPQQFAATITGNVSDLSVSWSVDGTAGGNSAVGTISAGGLYSPPATAGSHTVTATSNALPTSSGSASISVTDLAGVFTYHNDLARDGANTQEYALTPATVTTNTFGKLFACAVDGAVYTQPLWVPGLSIGGGTHNVIFVATEHDSLYAFDADVNPCVTYWHVNLIDTNHGGTTGETPIVWNDVGNCFGDVYPEVGVTGTPVIDPATSTIYLVSSSEKGSAGHNCSYLPGNFFRRLHALDLASATERFNGPVSFTASVPGTGDGGSTVNFDPQKHHQRSGLALANGTVYIAWAAHEDATPYHGWLFGYNASDLSQPPSVFNTTPDGGLGGIWGGGGAPAIDPTGDVYVATGNGIFDANSTTVPFADYGDSVLRLHPSAGSTNNGVNLYLQGWFTPFNQDVLSSNDADLGSGAPVLLSDQSVGSAHLLAQLGKDGIVYLINRDQMGQYNATDNSQIVQSFQGTNGGFWGTTAFWQNGLYFAGAYDSLRVYAFDPSLGLFNTNATSLTSNAFKFPDTTPSISSQGASNGIVWAIDAGLYGYASPNAAGGVNCYADPPPTVCTGPAVLHAYEATNLATELWNSSQASSNRDEAGNAVKFVPPTIANGKVYVSTRTEIDVYGLLGK